MLSPSSSHGVLALFLVWLLLKLFTTTRVALATGLRAVPGPFLSRWTVLPLKWKVISGYRTQYIHSLHKRYGPFVRISPTEIAISDVESFKAIHKIGSGFLKSEWYTKFNESDSGPGLFSMVDAKQHAVRRKLFAQSFSNSSILKYEAPVRDKIILAVSKIERDARSGTADVLKWWTFMATDVSGQLSFGRSFDMLHLEQKTEYIRDLETAQMIAGIRAELAPLVAIAGYIPVPSLQSALQLGPRLQSYGQKAIQNLYKYTQPDGSNATAPTTRPSCLFSSFVNSKHLREDEIAQEAGNLIVAGSDTTAVSLTYLTWAVLHPRNTRVRERLLAEVNTLPQDAPFSEIAQLQYLRAVVDECLRLFCAAPGSLPRAVPEPGVTLGKYFIPAGTTVSTQAFTLHRDANIFADPEVFNPDRWLDASAEMRSAYVPFGAGSRTCIGMHLALLEMQLAAFVFLKRMPEARLASVQEADRDMEFENYFLIAPRGHKCEVTLV